MNSFGEKKKLEKLVSDNNQLKMGQNVRATRNVSHMGRRIICTANESPHTNMNWCRIMYECKGQNHQKESIVSWTHGGPRLRVNS